MFVLDDIWLKASSLPMPVWRIHCGAALSVLSVIFVLLALRSLAMRLGGKLKSVVRCEKDHVEFAEEGVGCLQEPTCCVRSINHDSGQAMPADARASTDICTAKSHVSCFLRCHPIVFGGRKPSRYVKPFPFLDHYICELVPPGNECLEGHYKHDKDFFTLRGVI